MRSQSAASLAALGSPTRTSPAKRKVKGKGAAPSASATGEAMDELGLSRAATDSGKDSIPVFRQNFEAVAHGLVETRSSVDGLQDNVQRLTTALHNTQTTIADLTRSVRSTSADVLGLQAAHNTLVPLLDARHTASTERQDLLAARLNSVAGHVGTVASTVNNLQHMLSDVQRTVTDTQELLEAREAAVVVPPPAMPGPAGTHTYIISASTSPYSYLPVDDSPANKRMRLDNDMPVSSRGRGSGRGSRGGRGRGGQRGGHPAFPAMAAPMAASNAGAGPSTASGPSVGSGGHTDVLVGRCNWAAANVRDQFLNLTRQVRQENVSLMANALVNVSLDNDTSYARITFRSREQAAIFVEAFNARDASDYPETFARFATM